MGDEWNGRKKVQNNYVKKEEKIRNEEEKKSE